MSNENSKSAPRIIWESIVIGLAILGLGCIVTTCIAALAPERYEECRSACMEQQQTDNFDYIPDSDACVCTYTYSVTKFAVLPPRYK